MSNIRKTSTLLRNAIIVTIAVVIGFTLGDAFGAPIWLQGFFLIPAILLFYWLSGERRPATWKLLGFTVLLSLYVLLLTIGFKYVPEKYYLGYFLLIALIAPLGPVLNWFESRISANKNKS